SSRQVCGLYPFVIGSGAPNIGVPVGRHLDTGERVCCDPISWFQRAALISNPSAFVEAIPGIGKSTLVTRMLIGVQAYGAIPVVLGDIRPDYVDTIAALDGQVIRLGGGTGYLNPLDQGEALAAAARLTGAVRTEVLTDARARRRLRVMTLVQLSRGSRPSDRETNIVDRALEVLDERVPGTPVLEDLLEVIRSAPETVRAVALDRGDQQRYLQIVEDLEATLLGLVTGARFGDLFNRPTTCPMTLDSPVVFDVSQLRTSEEALQAAVLATSWSYGYGNIAAAQILADEGLRPRKPYFIVTDEIHRVLRAGGGGMVEVIDQATRLNRTDGTANVQITHTMSDLEALPNEEDRKKAIGFVERAGMVICGGLPEREMDMLTRVVHLSDVERARLTSWSAPAAWNRATGRQEPPPGRGKFLIKVGTRPGVPITLTLSEAEKAELTNSNHRWLDLGGRPA
ncbi:MAG: ATP/GTP-binding protein, partial [Cellulomonadaceae bacterium]|nr:ATP/GTP-binding protein [Cellulomonadaceae bacterium]